MSNLDIVIAFEILTILVCRFGAISKRYALSVFIVTLLANYISALFLNEYIFLYFIIAMCSVNSKMSTSYCKNRIRNEHSSWEAVNTFKGTKISFIGYFMMSMYVFIDASRSLSLIIINTGLLFVTGLGMLCDIHEVIRIIRNRFPKIKC